MSSSELIHILFKRSGVKGVHKYIYACGAREEEIMEEQKPKQEGMSPASVQMEPKPPKAPSPAVSGPLAQFEAWLYDVLVVKAPFQIPMAAKDWIVRYGPWITLVAGILLVVMVLPGLMVALAVAGYVAANAGLYGTVFAGGVVGPMYFLAIAILVLQLIVMFISVPMLMKRQRRGWLLLFYSAVVSLVYTVFNAFSYGFFDLGGLLLGLIGATIGMYVIFQIRSYYKN